MEKSEVYHNVNSDPALLYTSKTAKMIGRKGYTKAGARWHYDKVH